MLDTAFGSNINMNLFNFVICLVLMSCSIGNSLRVLMFERLTVEHKVLEGSPVSLRCVSQKMESVRIFQRYISEEGDEVEVLLVKDLALSEDHHGLLFSYNYSWSTNSGRHDLTINNADRTFLRHLFVCVTTQTFTPYKLRIIDVFYHPTVPLEFNVIGDDKIPAFLTEDIGKIFEVYCTTESGKPPAAVTISNSHVNLFYGNDVHTSRNNTHSMSHFSGSLENSWNDSYFYCNVTQSFPPDTNIQDYVLSRSYGPLLFYDKLHVVGPVQAQHFRKEDVVNFTCAPNINFAKAEWTEILIPDQISVLDRSVGPSLSFYIEDINDTLNILIITASCKVSLKGRHAFKTFVAYSTIKVEPEQATTRNDLKNEVETKAEINKGAYNSVFIHETDFGRIMIVTLCGFFFLNVLFFLSVLLVKRKCRANGRRDSFRVKVNKKEQIGRPLESQIKNKTPEEISDDPPNAYSKQVHLSGHFYESNQKYCSVRNDHCFTFASPTQRHSGVTLSVDSTDLRESKMSPGSSIAEKNEEKYERTIESGLYGGDCRIGRLGCYSTRVHPEAPADRTFLDNTTKVVTFPGDDRRGPLNINDTEFSIYSEIS